MTYSYEEVSADIRQQLSELLGVPANEIGDDDLLVEDLGASSIAIVQLFLNCQEQYDVKLDDEFDLLRPITVREFTNTVIVGKLAPTQDIRHAEEALADED